MICSNCGHQNEGGKFCVKCGTKLVEETAEQQQAAAVEPTIPVSEQPVQQEPAETVYSTQPTSPVQPVQPAEPNKHVEAAKNVSKLYFSYFIEGLKNPTKAAQSVRQEQFVNGLITMILYALCIPITIYFGLKTLFKDIPFLVVLSEEMSFTSVLKPTFFSLVIIAFIALITFAVIKLGRVQITIKDIFARFGTFLIVPTALLIVALILSIINVDFYLYIWFFGLLGLLFVVPLTIFSFKKDIPFGLDGLYGTLINYIVIFIILNVIIDSYTEKLGTSLLDFFNY